MARKTKARTRSASARKPATRNSKTKKAPAKKAPAKKPARKGVGKHGTEVEKRWADYLEQRTALEEAVTAVQAAAQELASARQIETEKRREFDECKRTLEQLLEVDPAAGGVAGRERKPLDFARPGAKPPSRDKGEEREA